jgi:hypothetical protein
MPEFFRSTAKKPGATKVRKGYKSGGGDWIQGAIKRPGAFTKKAKDAGMSVSKYANKVLKKGSDASTRTKKQASLAKTLRSFHADGGLTGVSGYKPVLGNNKFGYPSGGVPVKSFKGGGAAVKGLGRAFIKK